MYIYTESYKFCDAMHISFPNESNFVDFGFV